MSKTAMKQKKKRDARKAKKLEEGCGYTSDYDAEVESKSKSNIVVTLTGDLEKDKKIKNIKKVLKIVSKIFYSNIKIRKHHHIKVHCVAFLTFAL